MPDPIPNKELKIGTRGSPLALVQAEDVQRRLLAAHPELTPDDVTIVLIVTTGDRVQDRTLLELGGKGLFTQEIEEQLLSGDIDLAVHSSKDMPTRLPEGLELSVFLPREDPRDAFISFKSTSLQELPQGAVLGTASLRRGAQALKLRPDLNVVAFRGNVGTRLKKLEDGVVDATMLAQAGLNRLDRGHVATAVMDIADMLPAPAQGAVGIETRVGDSRVAEFLAPLHDVETAYAVTAERALLEALDGSCRTPIAALGEVAGDRLTLRSRLLSPDGAICFEDSEEGSISDAVEIGRAAGGRLRAEAGPEFFEALIAYMSGSDVR